MLQTKCPYCSSASVELTCAGDKIQTYLCIGPDQHEWTHPMEASDDEESLIVLTASEYTASR